MRHSSVEPYDALLLVSFGGPEGPDDVVPFLENVTRGRGIPRERLAEVGQHYSLFGGRSPINDQNRHLLAALRDDLAHAGIDLPVYWGNRNWDPFLADTVATMARDGIERAACFVTSAYSSYSGCRQYREDLAAAAEAVYAMGLKAPRLDRLRAYFNHPGFLDPLTDAALAAVAELPDPSASPHVLFVTHSIPETMNAGSGPEGGAYVAQHRAVMHALVARMRQELGRELPYELVYCSRSGPPQVPWLEPDVNDRIADLATAGATGVVLVPIGFVSDHMEVIYDLDTEARATAERHGIALTRAATPGIDARFVGMIRQLLIERAATERGEAPLRTACGALDAAPDYCLATCCPHP
ncbi:MAG: ferrochelatase, partial [Nocardioides sp.]